MTSVAPPVAQLLLPVDDVSHVAQARRMALRLAQSLGFEETTAANVELALTEAATNILKHARHGHLLVRGLRRNEARGIEVLALDRGPGISNLQDSLRDGFSTSGSLGAGMSTFARLASEWDIYSLAGKGTALRLELWEDGAKPSPTSVDPAALCVPKPGEEICGDAWAFRDAPGRHLVMVADGLGHGPDAAQASLFATEVLATSRELEPQTLIEAIHRKLASTRGAAVGIASIDSARETVTFAGIGNIAALVFLPDQARKHLVSRNGIVGHNLSAVREMSIAFPRRSLLVLHSDGLGTHWNLADYPGLHERHPGLLAGVLWRDFWRGRDDVTVVVLRNGAGAVEGRRSGVGA